MRLKITLETEKLPLQYQFLFISYIKESLKIDSPHLLKMFEENNQLKPYTFSVFLNDFELNREEFIINKEVNWYISSHDAAFLISLYNGLRKQKLFSYRGYELKPKNIQMVKENKVTHSMLIGRFMSPLVVQNKNKTPVSPYESEFETELNYISNITLKQTIGRTLKQPIIFHPMEMKKVIRKMPSHKTNKSVSFESWKGDFALSGDTEDLQLLYALGVGFRRSQGHGMFEIL